MLTINGRGESGQDNFAFEVCGRKPAGTFLDIGCNEPRRWNNTFALEEVGWRGWALDINPDYAPDWVKERATAFLAADATAVDWKALVGDVAMPIDYLSLDIDENESRDLATTILKNLFAAGLSFRCATIEHDAYRFEDHPRAAIRQLMFNAGYNLAHANVEIRKGNGKPFEDWWVKA